MTALLREQLGWKRLIVADDLHMGALTQKYSTEAYILIAIEAGADILIFSSNAKDMPFDPDFPQKAHEILVRLVEEGKIPQERLRESWERIVEAKKHPFPSAALREIKEFATIYNNTRRGSCANTRAHDTGHLPSLHESPCRGIAP